MHPVDPGKTTVLSAVRQCGMQLKHASAMRQEDPEVVLEAVRCARELLHAVVSDGTCNRPARRFERTRKPELTTIFFLSK